MGLIVVLIVRNRSVDNYGYEDGDDGQAKGTQLELQRLLLANTFPKLSCS